MQKIANITVSFIANIRIVGIVLLILLLIVCAIALIYVATKLYKASDSKKEKNSIIRNLVIWIVIIAVIIAGLIGYIAVYHYYPELALINRG